MGTQNLIKVTTTKVHCHQTGHRWAMVSRDGDDVCRCRMAALFGAHGLTRSDKDDVAKTKVLPITRSTHVSIMIVNRLANDRVVKSVYD